MLRQYHIKNYDFKLILLVVALTVVGIVTIGSANSEFQDKQIMGLFIGLFIMVVVSLIDYSFILRFSWVLYGINLLLLILVAVSTISGILVYNPTSSNVYSFKLPLSS